MVTSVVVMIVLLFGGITLAFYGGEQEVEPQEALVYKNIVTGEPGAFSSGVDYLKPWEKKLQTITLRNEPHDPPKVNVNTADPVPIGVDYVLTDFRVAPNKEAMCLAYTKIDYEKRLANTLTRINAFMQDCIGRRQFNSIYDGKTNRDVVSDIEDEVNLKLKLLETEWGLIVKIQIREIEVPAAISHAKADAVTAQYEGEAIKKKAEAAGTSANVRDVILAEAVVEGIRALRGVK